MTSAVPTLVPIFATPFALVSIGGPADLNAALAASARYRRGAGLTVIVSDLFSPTGYQQGMLLEQILKQCGNDLSRTNIATQAKSLKDVVLPTALPGIKINTSATSNMVWTQMQLQRWNGTSWDQFGEVLDAASE